MEILKNLGTLVGQLAKLFKPKAMFAIDISKWNGKVDFEALRFNSPKVDLVIIRCSEGNKNADPMFATNVRGCKAEGFLWQVYHFCTWNDADEVKDATGEAKFLISQLEAVNAPKDTRFWIDTESNKTNIILSRAEMGIYLDTFINVMAAAGYTNPGIYGGKGFISSFYPLNHKYGNLPLWVASYNGKTKPTMPPGWKTYELWQYTDKGQVKGVKTACDLNRGPA